MSLLDRGPHVVVVTPRTPGPPDRANNPTTVDGTPVTVRGLSVQPVSAAETTQLDVAPGTLVCRIYGRGPWPGGPESRVKWRGRVFDQLGEALEHSTGRLTRHIEVLIAARKAVQR